MLIDRAEIILRGGQGGNGIVSFGKMTKSGPDGGNGGNGGDLYVRAVSDMTLLNQFGPKTEFDAERGVSGGQDKMTGRRGKDLEILLPVGTSLIDMETGRTIVELTKVDQRELVCKGGKGGRGNWEFRSSRNTTPKEAESGKPGEERRVIVELKLIAEYGFIGLPNTGKSSLLNELTNAKAKTGNYSFTTLSPDLGVYKGKVIADIPGLIEGASHGRGLGISFLKHIEKVRILLHCISLESKDPVDDYKTVRNELGSYNKKLLNKDEIILLTKRDLVDDKTAAKFEKVFLKKSKNVIPISIHDFESLEKLKEKLI
jgi:GTPase